MQRLVSAGHVFYGHRNQNEHCYRDRALLFRTELFGSLPEQAGESDAAVKEAAQTTHLMGPASRGGRLKELIEHPSIVLGRLETGGDRPDLLQYRLSSHHGSQLLIVGEAMLRSEVSAI